ncbi:hypothetical protein L596_003532 [Steinernema carpocapsae]|uniref:Uncharacterized protein n=1 Tax=Steinernema carpocapsae TaxID=34508 RepID=A0A4V6I7T5_STECR|nr:hypothetical protein L596_003532 [Steinernema carpocapsae]
MSNFPIYRAKSTILPPRSRDLVPTVATLSRVSSVPNLHVPFAGERYRPSTLFKYRRDWELLDDYWHDRYIFNQPLYWPDYRFAARRYVNTDPIPGSIGAQNPSFYTRYKWYSDWLNPVYWRRYRDPNYDRPLWNSWKPWEYDRLNVKRAVKMYKDGLINFNQLDKFWIEPRMLGRGEKDYSDVYLPAGRYGPRRYFYSFL